MNDWALSEIERMLANLVRVGTVEELDAKNARVKIKTAGLVTDWLPWTTSRAGGNRTWDPPEKGEQVLVMSPYGDLGQAVVIPSIYQDAHAANGDDENVSRTTYKDGTVVEYDRESHKMLIDVSASSGSVTIVCKTATVKAEESVTLDTPETHCTGNLTVQKRLTYLGGMAGSNINGGPGAAAVIDGDLRTANGEFSHNGVNVGSTHRHTEQGDGNQTSPPIQ